MTGWNRVTLEPRRPGVRGCSGEEWDAGSWAWAEWTLRASEQKVTPGPSGQPSCLTDVEAKTQKALAWVPIVGRGCSQGLNPGLLVPIPVDRGAVWSAGAGLLLAQPLCGQQRSGHQRSWVASGGRWGCLEPGVNCGACEPTGQGEACGSVCHLGLRGTKKDPAPGKPPLLALVWPGSTITASPPSSCRVPAVASVPGRSHVQAFLPTHQPHGVPRNRDRIDTGVGSGARQTSRLQGRGRPSPGFRAI